MSRVTLKSGILDISVVKSDLALSDLCGFAARNNLKRGYLFVSKVLGKHYPVSPSIMRNVYELLAEKLYGADISYPVLFIAMAETATALGQGVFESFLKKKSCNNNLLFTQTTRYLFKQPIALCFQEIHSHAKDHILYEPYFKKNKDIFYNAKTLVIVDDEISTGNTLINLVKAYFVLNASLGKIIFVNITNWLDENKKKYIIEQMPCPIYFINILEASFNFTADTDFSPNNFSNSDEYEYKDDLISNHFGRFGYNEMPSVNGYDINIDKKQKILILGTGEFMFLPFKFAEYIEKKGYNVKFQATTRSPIMIGNDIKHCIEFEDNYFDGMKNYLYNVCAKDYDKIIICYETKKLPLSHDLPIKLEAEIIFFKET